MHLQKMQALPSCIFVQLWLRYVAPLPLAWRMASCLPWQSPLPYQGEDPDQASGVNRLSVEIVQLAVGLPLLSGVLSHLLSHASGGSTPPLPVRSLIGLTPGKFLTRGGRPGKAVTS